MKRLRARRGRAAQSQLSIGASGVDDSGSWGGIDGGGRYSVALKQNGSYLSFTSDDLREGLIAGVEHEQGAAHSMEIKLPAGPRI